MLKVLVNDAYDTPAYDEEPMGTETMGDRIRTLRNSRRLSQDALADILGVTGPAISQWESGNTKNIKIDTFLKLCDFFMCDPHWLGLGDEGAPRDRPSPNSKPGSGRA